MPTVPQMMICSFSQAHRRSASPLSVESYKITNNANSMNRPIVRRITLLPKAPRVISKILLRAKTQRRLLITLKCLWKSWSQVSCQSLPPLAASKIA